MLLQILLWLGAAILVVIVPLMILPVRIEMSLQSDPASRATILLRPFGGVFPSLRVFDSLRKAQAKEKEPPKPRRRKKARDLRWHVIRTLPQVIGRVIRSIHIDTLRIDADFGLGDPAETGQFYGHLTPFIYGSGGRVSLRPDFEVACLRGTAFAQLSIVPIVFIWPILGFLWRLFGPFE